MPRSRIDTLRARFHEKAETIHEDFLAIQADSSCRDCRTAGFGEAVLSFALQTAWSNFCHDLVVASALGTRRSRGNPIRPVSGVRSLSAAIKLIREAARDTVLSRRLGGPIWHAPWFTIEIGAAIGLNNQKHIELVLGSALAPDQVTKFRNYLAHPMDNTRAKYDELLQKIGMPRVEPEELLHQEKLPGLSVFTDWVRELQRIAYDSTN